MRVAASLIVLTLTTLAGAADGDRVATIDGRELVGRVVTVDAQAVRIATADGEQTVARTDVAAVALESSSPGRRAELMRQPGKMVVETIGGDCVAPGGLTFADGKLTMTGGLLGDLSVPIDRIKTIYFPTVGQSAADVRELCQQMKLTGEVTDQMLMVDTDGKLLPVAGVLRAIGLAATQRPAAEITFTWQGRDRTVAAERARAIVLASPPREIPQAVGVVAMTDGSALRFSDIELTDEKVLVQSPELGVCTIRRDAVAEIRFHSDRVVPLGDLEPVDVREHGLMAWTFAYRRDRNVTGGAIQLDGRTYARGIGMHSFCELTYDLDGAFSLLVMTAGIDDAAGPHGDAVLTIIADGKTLAEPVRLTGRDEAWLLRLDVANVKRLIVRVDYGPDELDVADCVDLADARLIK